MRFDHPGAAVPGRTGTRAAGIVADLFAFDPGHFGISPREAEQMDPQQRLLLRAAAAAFDDAGIDPARLDRDRTGVFVGASGADYANYGTQNPEAIGPHFMLGNTLSILANRISYQWDFRGPSYTVDTACSSGLFALDRAREAIAAGTIDTAVVGAVNVLLSPMPFVGFAQAGMLSPDGLCKAFAEGADGYVRAEGAVVFVLQRADLARTEGLRLRSILVGTGVNSDGRTNGIALPSAGRQCRLIEQIRDRFGIDPEDLAFAEAHGTGTLVGDPAEAEALGRAYGQHRTRPLPIGSAKTNFGHLEPASGLVGLLKAQLALDRGLIPASLHAERLNPAIDFAGLNLEVVRKARPIPGRDRPWAAAVSSFGFGGANAHAVIRQPDAADRAAPPAPDALPPALLLTAASPEALARTALAWCRVADDGPALAQAVADANRRRARHARRLCLPLTTPAALQADLDRLGADPKALAQASERGLGHDLPVAFVFSGNGALWDGVARDIYLSDRRFRDTFDAISEDFGPIGDMTLRGLLLSATPGAAFERAELAQPLHFAIQCGLVEALAEAGLRPAAVLGHSLGEVAAAVAAGRITRAEAVRIVASRGRAFRPLHGTGGMAALAASVAEARALIAEGGQPVSIAAENAPASVTLSGPVPALEQVLALARRRRLAGKLLPIAYPYHSPAVDPLHDRLLADLAHIGGRPSEVAFYSGCMGARQDAVPLDAGYWWRNARQPVAFRPAVAAMLADGVRLCVEITPRSLLRGYLRDIADETGHALAVVETLDPARVGDIDAVVRRVLMVGGTVDETRLLGPRRPWQGGLPPTPLELRDFALPPGGIDLFGRQGAHPLAGFRIDPEIAVWTGSVSLSRMPWLADHRVRGRCLLPATAMIEMLRAVARAIDPERVPEVRDLDFLRPVEVSEAETPLRLRWEPAARRLTIETRGAAGGGWAEVALARLFTGSAPSPDAPRPRACEGPAEQATGDLYAALDRAGLQYGPAFRRLAGLSPDGPDAVLARIAPAPPPDETGMGMGLDPAALDAVLHAAAALAGNMAGGAGDDARDASGGGVDGCADGGADGGPMVPVHVARLWLWAEGRVASARLVRRHRTADELVVDVTAQDGDGRPLLGIEGLRLRRLPAEAASRGLYWHEVWLPLPGFADLPLDAPLAVLAAGDPATAEPSDHDVLRAAAAGRLAVEILIQGATGTPDPRLPLVADWLVAQGHAEVDAEGLLRPASNLPWPDIDTLIALLAETVPGAQDDLLALLGALPGAASGRAAPSDGAGRLARRLLDALPAAAGETGPRLLLAGAVDAALLAAACRVAGQVAVAAADADGVARAAARLPAGQAVRFVALDDAALRGGFDLVVGAAVAQVLPAASWGLLGGTLADGGRIVLAEERADLFALLTGRLPRPDMLDRLAEVLRAAGCTIRTEAAAGFEALVLLSGRADRATVLPPVCLTVTGAGALAEGLTALSDPEAKAALDIRLIAATGDPLARSLARAAALADLPQGRPVWLIEEDPDAAEELSGWRRVAVNETGADLRSLACPPGTAPAVILRLIATTPETEIRLDGHRACAPRLRPLPVPDAGAATGEGWRLDLARRTATLDGLGWRAAPRRAPGPGEVEIAVAATGLNFRDVMWGQGLLPPEALENGFAGAGFGMECAGRVLRVGEGVNLTPGQPVAAFAPQAFASHLTVPATTVLPLPEGIDPAAAATLPVAALTADYALNELARPEPGDWVLIHGAAGGVGLAAVQIARGRGARVIGSAGSAAKRRLLQALGVEATVDSRGHDFADRVIAITGGRGVDVVLNSLFGERMETSLACLAPFGRFVELGKRDIYGHGAMGLRAMRLNASWFGVDVDQLLRHRPDVAARAMARLARNLAGGQLLPLPYRRFAAQDVAEAFRLMQGAGHVGKILVTPPPAPAAAPGPVAPPIAGAWLVTGGTSGFGLATAEWLAGQGARHLILVSRTGQIESTARARIEATGARVETFACDVSNEAALGALCIRLTAGGVTRLGGVIHAAMVLDDAPLTQLDPGRIGAVLAPKILGARALDRLTRPFKPAHFWLFSSVAARLGNPGQAPYVAANRAVEALARQRRAEGLPALAIAWGPIADRGYLARTKGLRAALEDRLGRLLDSAAALAALGRLAATPDLAPAVTVAPMDWGRLAADLPVLAGPLFDEIDLSRAGAGAEADLAGLVARHGAAKARRMVLALLQAEAARILRAAPSDVDPARPFAEMGFDSLMAMSLRVAVESRLGVELPVTSLADGLTLQRLVQLLFERLTTDGPDRDEALYDRHLTETRISAAERDDIATRSGVRA